MFAVVMVTGWRQNPKH